MNNGFIDNMVGNLGERIYFSENVFISTLYLGYFDMINNPSEIIESYMKSYTVLHYSGWGIYIIVDRDIRGFHLDNDIL